MSAESQRRTRLAPEERKRQLRVAARNVFAERGYAISGLAEIAEQAGVNKRLLYYYYPDGRPELFVAVVREIADDLLERVRGATSAPLNTARRTERLVEALLGFAAEQPDALRLLFAEPMGVREPEIVQLAASIRSELAMELARLFAAGGAPVALVDAVATGAVEYIVRVISLAADGDISRETALDACHTCIQGAVGQLGG